MATSILVLQHENGYSTNSVGTLVTNNTVPEPPLQKINRSDSATTSAHCTINSSTYSSSARGDYEE